MTALATAADSRIPLVVFAGESPINAPVGAFRRIDPGAR